MRRLAVSIGEARLNNGPSGPLLFKKSVRNFNKPLRIRFSLDARWRHVYTKGSVPGDRRGFLRLRRGPTRDGRIGHRDPGAREHNLRDVSLTLPRGRLICLTGRVGLGEELAGVRHAVCRGAAAVRREPLELRPPVPRADAQAPGRPDRRAESVDLDPAEDRRSQPADRRSARSPRSTTTCGCCSPASGRATAPTAAGRSPRRPASRSSRGSSRTCPPAPRYLVLAPVVRGQKGEYKDLFAEL